MKYKTFIRLLLGFIGIFILWACESKSNVEEAIEQIPVDIEVIRFDKIFGRAAVGDLPNLKAEYPMFFPSQYPDSVWVNRLSDTIQIELNTEVAKVFPSEEKFEEELSSLFQHILYYYPSFEVPKVFTTTSDVDYRTKVIAAKDMLILELDTYLGNDHYFYEGIAKYITKNMNPSMISSDVASVYAKQYIPVPRDRHFLAQMLYFGKELYLKDLWLPDASDAKKIGYTEEELEWAKANEAYIWSYFIEKELLYSVDSKLPNRFINPAPFSKFQLELDNESPGMIGRFIGWQMVRAYMEKNETPLEEMLQMAAEDLFKNSKYKPKK